MISQKKFVNDFKITQKKFPKLQYKILTNNNTIVFGVIDIFDKEGIYWDSFEISISIGGKYPFEIPLVYELSKKIERIKNRHIDKNGLCCIDIPHNLIYDSHKGIILCEFISNKVIPYFANQIYFNKKGEFAEGEWSHDFNGIIDFYSKKLNIKDIKLSVKIINAIIENKIPLRNEMCICGIKKFKNCHESAVNFLQIVGKKKLLEDLSAFIKLI